MLSNDHVQNSILHRPNSKTKKLPFLVPISDSVSTLPTHSKIFTANSNEKSIGSRKSIRILRPETIKRAINDACMAAAIGDLEWLKQTMKISTEKAFDKDGFATIHLASIHGRMNIIKFLIEEQNYDPNFPSSVHCWCPIHLCISNQIGSRALDCLKYLIEKGAKINVKNADDIYPLHMAASEGQVDCLKILLELKADASVKDKRGQTPLDLAKLWGHRTCAKKKVEQELQVQDNLIKTQDILKEVEQAHETYYNDKEESQKNFEKWLINQGFEPEKKPEPKEKKEVKEVIPSLLLIPDTEVSKSEQEKYLKSFSALDFATSEISEDRSKREVSLKPRKMIEYTPVHHPKEWNYSTKSKEKEYVPNLNDFYPRDPYTLLPTNVDLVLVNKELKGMSLEQVKQFMKKKLKRDKSSDKTSNSERPVYHKPKNIVDAQTKIRPDEEQKGIDLAGMFLGNDPESFAFRQANNYIARRYEKYMRNKKEESTFGNYYDTKNTLKLIQKQLSPNYNNTVKDEKLEIVKRHYGHDLTDFMTDKRHGKMSQKYEKVFII